MGLMKSGLLACLVAGLTAFGQQGVPPGTNPAPAPAPGADPNAPVLIPQPTPTPEVDPNVLQPVTPDTSTPATTPAPTASKPKPKKPAAAALPTLRGTVGTIDKTNMTVVIHGKKDETLKITSNTRIFADNKPAILSDAKEGEDVVATYRNAKDKSKEALTLRFGKAAAVAAKKPVAKKPASKAVPSEDAAAPVNATPLPDTNTPPVTSPDPNAPAPNPGAPAPNPGVPSPTP